MTDWADAVVWCDVADAVVGWGMVPPSAAARWLFSQGWDGVCGYVCLMVAADGVDGWEVMVGIGAGV